MKNTNPVSPPQWPLTLLRFFLKKEYLEEIEGDLEEIFRDALDRNVSPRLARRLYTWEAVKLLRPVLMKNMNTLRSFTPLIMYKNYFKTSFRSLVKNPVSSFINVFGLSVAIGICLVVYAFLEYDKNIDQYHTHKNEVHLATFYSANNGQTQQYGLTPRPLAEMLKQDVAAIRNVCRVADHDVVLKCDDNTFHERVWYVDATFLEMFTFPLKWGRPSTLADLNSIILSEKMSVKYFGEDNPVGRDMLMILSDSVKKVFTVTGVAAAFPDSRDIEFDFLINFNNLQVADPAYDVNDWAQFVNATFVQVEKGTDVHTIENSMDKYRALQNEAQPDWAATSFALEPLATLHERANNLKYAIVHDTNLEARIGMPVIAIFMIVLACFNYINIAIVSAARRLKEIGVRKVIGANRSKVVTQFLTENMVVTLFAMSVGLALSYFVFVPWFAAFSSTDFELNLLSKYLWIFLVALVFLMAIISGMYPAFYISTFDTIKIFKGSMRFGKKNALTKVFLAAQLVLACMTITAAVVFTQNNKYQHNRSWGYDQEGVLYVQPHDAPAFERIKTAMLQNPDVVALSGASDHLGKSVTAAVVRTPAQEQHNVDRFSVQASYLETMGLHILTGRAFREDSETDKRAILVNELFLKETGLQEPLGQQIELDSVKYEVIGVLKDFHTRDFFSKVEPAVFTLASDAEYRYLSIRVRRGTEENVYKNMQQKWAGLYPEIPFKGGYQEDVWSGYFVSLNRSEQFNKVIATIAVLLACLGLYGLVTLNVTGRTKEFSIRKTLGAGVTNLTSAILKQYTVLTLLSLLIGAPVSYLFTEAYLDMLFAYHMPMTYSGILIALVILIGVLLVVFSTQVHKVMQLNTVEGLKTE